MRRGAAGKKGKKKGQRERIQEQESEQMGEEDDMNLMDQANMGIDQLQLTQEEKDESVIKTLTADNPQAPHNVCQYSFKDRHYKVEDQVDMLTFHYNVEGNIMLKESDEAMDQESFWDDKKRMNTKLLENVNAKIKEDLGTDGPTEGDEIALKKSLRNQFNFQERSSQTFNLPLREKGMKTDPPVMSNFSLETTQWMIFDSYMQQYEDMQRQELEEQMKNKKDKKPQQIQQQHVEDPLYSTTMKRCLKIMERMIVQNADDEKFEDYKYYEDNTMDRESGNFGSVLPLWRFSTEKSRKKHVTSIQWNPRYRDLFAVGYGSYDFLKQSTGLICCYTIKNPIWPEYQFQTESGVMCLDFHPTNPALLAVGLYDGTVMVFDIRLKGNNKPIYMSTVRTAKHTDPVW
jgi:dynein intermediate chain 1